MLKVDVDAEPRWLGEIASEDPADPRPFLFPDVRVRFLPIGRKAVRAAREAVRVALGLDAADLIGAGDALSEELIRRGIAEWEGVGDRDGEPVPVDPVAVDAFLRDLDRFETCDRVYVGPWARRDMEGNVSAGSPSGTGTAATPADDTATRSATPGGSAAAAPTRKRGKAASARTSSTNPRPKRAKGSGTS